MITFSFQSCSTKFLFADKYAWHRRGMIQLLESNCRIRLDTQLCRFQYHETLWDPVSGSHCRFLLFGLVAPIHICPFVDWLMATFFIWFRLDRIIEFTFAQSSISSLRYKADSGSIGFESAGSFSILPELFAAFTCQTLCNWQKGGNLDCLDLVYWPATGEGNVLEPNVLAKWHIFLQILHYASLARHILICTGDKIPQFSGIVGELDCDLVLIWLPSINMVA